MTLRQHPLYVVWRNLRQRCNNKNNKFYKNYGGRGISVCEEWEANFKSFFNWAINNGWSRRLQLERIDNDGNYTPSNCTFVNRKLQCRNRTNNRMIEFNGETRCLAEWAELKGLQAMTLSVRLKSGWPIEKALHQKSRRTKTLTN